MFDQFRKVVLRILLKDCFPPNKIKELFENVYSLRVDVRPNVAVRVQVQHVHIRGSDELVGK